MAAPESYTLLELNQYIRRVLALNFDQPLWIEAEISQAGASRGHWYLDLVQKDGDQLVAQSQAALWANVYHFLKRKLPVPPEEILQPGLAVKLKVNVDFHERYGLKLIIEDIDPAFTLGQLALQREAILQALTREQLLERNGALRLPLVIQRLAVISSSRAAGWIDFERHLTDNRFGYAIGFTLFESAMQGQAVEREVLAALDQIESRRTEFDAVAILRGGGGRTDLAAFDNLALARRVARCSLPVLVGIGHEIDQSVLDLVAHTSLKTPTAVADFVVGHNQSFEAWLDRLDDGIRAAADTRLGLAREQLRRISADLSLGVQQAIWQQARRLDEIQTSLRHVSHATVQQARFNLDRLEELVRAVDPDQVLARGYTITSSGGRTVRQAADLKPGTRIQTTFLDGNIQSITE